MMAWRPSRVTTFMATIGCPTPKRVCGGSCVSTIRMSHRCSGGLHTTRVTADRQNEAPYRGHRPPYTRGVTARPDDEAASRKVATAYLESWLDGDGARMKGALHPMLAKRG